MKIKNFVMSIVLLAGSMTAAAQETKTEVEYVPNWYVGAQVGGQYTLGEASFGKLLSPNAQILVGRNFNPVVGLRLGVNAWQSKGAIDSRVFGNPRYKWNYVAPNLDVTFNLTNLFRGYKPGRLVNIGAFAGIGANIAWNNDEAGRVRAAIYEDWAALGAQPKDQNMRLCWDGTKVWCQGRAGLTLDLNITDQFAVGAEVSANVLTDRYNSKDAGSADWYFNALVGVKYTFGKPYKTREVEVAAPAKIIQEIHHRDTVYVVSEPAAPVVVAPEREPLRVDVFFTISVTKLTPLEEQKLREVVAYLNKYPESKVSITGYADKGTGKAEGNMRLSERRADYVFNALTKSGIPASRIIKDFKGDTVQPFEINDMNRVTICICE